MPRDVSVALAVRTLAILAVHPDGVVSSDRLGELLAANPVVIRRVVGRLRWDGVVETRRGRGGGCALALEPSKITLGRLHRALRGADDAVTGGAALAVAMGEAEASYARALDRWTVADVIEGLPQAHS